MPAAAPRPRPAAGLRRPAATPSARRVACRSRPWSRGGPVPGWSSRQTIEAPGVRFTATSPTRRRSSTPMADTRTERDSMGPMEVPADAYYGASTQRAVENFPISGQGIPSELVRALGLIKAAAAVVNHQKKILDDDQFRAITEAAQEVIDG